MDATLPLNRFPGANALIVDYAGDFDRIRPWFHYDPHDQSSLSGRLDELDGRREQETHVLEARKTWAGAVQAQLLQWQAGEPAREAAERLAEPGTCVVATGQQVGLFGGPLYSAFKALSAVACARLLKKQFPGRAFVPVFWLGTSDSDYEEVRKHWLLDSQGTVRELALPPEAQDESGILVSARSCEGPISKLAAELAQALPGGPWRDEVIAGLNRAYQEGNLAHGFARWLAQLFTDTELVPIDSQDPVLMQAAAPLIRHELLTASDSRRLLDERSDAIQGAGYHPQLTQLEGDTGLFLLDTAHRRDKIVRSKLGFSLRHSGQRFSQSELLGLADTAPERFVLGVTLRPIYQNALFPVAAFVGGAAEIAYRAQLSSLFEHHGQRMAPAFLRASATLLTERAFATLEELDWNLDQCFALPQELAAAAVANQRPDELDSALASYRLAIASADDELKRLAVALDHSLERVFDTLKANLERHMEKLEKKITNVLKSHNESLLRRVEKLHSLVYPLQSPQERTLSLLSFLPQYGFGFIRFLLERLRFPCWEHQLVLLE